MHADALFEAQKHYFSTGVTRDVQGRIKTLKTLKSVILKYENKLIQALAADLDKSEYEVVTTEIGMVLKEIDFICKKLPRWQKTKRRRTNLINLPGHSYSLREPYGTALIIGPWNYPFQLVMAPLVGAIAGGNTAVVKPSELAVNTVSVIERIIEESFPSQYTCVLTGGVEVTQKLLDQKFDIIFFTGSPRVGKIVMEKASRHLTKVILELGGKSPCIIDETAALEVAVKRILFGKAGNAGQTCVAPDYVLIHKSKLDEFIRLFGERTIELYGTDSSNSTHYGSIINQAHYDRLKSYLSQGKILFGGECNDRKRKIGLTLMADVSPDAALMQDEIFGPILPIITYEREEDIYSCISARPDPLALYIFSTDSPRIRRILERVPFGGGCVNDTIMHLTNEYLPFGGRGNSGTGSYHGYASFAAFTHEKSVFHNTNLFDLPLKYPPHSTRTLRLIKKIMYHLSVR